MDFTYYHMGEMIVNEEQARNQRAAYAETIEVFDVHEQQAVYAVQCVDRSRATWLFIRKVHKMWTFLIGAAFQKSGNG